VPTIIVVRGFRLFFFSNEGEPREPLHVHVERAGGRAKFWLEPEVRLESEYAFPKGDLKEAERLIREHADLIRSRWHEHFGP